MLWLHFGLHNFFSSKFNTGTWLEVLTVKMYPKKKKSNIKKGHFGLEIAYHTPWYFSVVLNFEEKKLCNPKCNHNMNWYFFRTLLGLLVSDLTYTTCTKHLLNFDVLVWLFAFSCYTIHTSLKNDIYQCIG
jgi:hypothetical protein